MATKPPRPKKPAIDPFDLALITGKPLPATFSHWRAAWRVEHPRDRGLLNGMPSLDEIWQQHHGRPMTDEEAAAIAARWPEVEAAVAVLRARRTGRQGPAPSNWPAAVTEGFTPIARIEDDDH